MSYRLEEQWTDEEIKNLKNNYSNKCINIEDILLLFPNRNLNAIRMKAFRLNLKRNYGWKKKKQVYLAGGSIEGCQWNMRQSIDECGNVEGIGFFQFIERERARELNRNWHRKHRLGSVKNGQQIVYWNLNKRDFPKENICELCGKKFTRLSYHHWDDENPNKGIWICYYCHWLISYLENTSLEFIKEMIDKYKKIKNEQDENLLNEKNIIAE